MTLPYAQAFSSRIWSYDDYAFSQARESFKPLRGERKVVGHVARVGFPYAPCRR
jgi:hypothetical protein